MMGTAGARMREACAAEVRRRADGGVVVRDVVVEYLAALDDRRQIATEEVTSSGGRVLRGVARGNVVKAAQHRLEAAEVALRQAVQR